MSRKKCQKNELSDEQLLQLLDVSEDENSSSESETDSCEDSSEMSSEDNVPVNNKNVRPVVTGDKWFNNPKPSKPIIFSQNSGLKVQTAGHKEIDYFNLLVSDSFYNLVIDETNLYAVEILSKSSVQARISHWKDLTVDEFKVFLGLLFHTGTIRLNKLEDYWITDDLFDLQCFRKHMSRNRFLLILRALHFGHLVENQNYRLFRIQPILNYINNKMDDIYYPKKNLSIVESMILWRGRLIFRQ